MKSRAALTLMVLLLLAVPISHLQLQQVDQRWLLAVDGRQLDVAGQWSDSLNRWLRDCSLVRVVPAQEGTHAQVVKAIGQYSPPDSQELRLSGLWQKDDWLLAEVDFTRLAPAVVVLWHQQGAWEVHTSGVWSGSTHPHWPASFIRQYLGRKVPQVPPDLLACFDPSPTLFQRAGTRPES